MAVPRGFPRDGLRLLASLVLAAVFASQAFCFLHCHLPSTDGVPDSHPALTGCCHRVSAGAEDLPEGATGSAADGTCSTLSTWVGTGDAPRITPPPDVESLLVFARVLTGPLAATPTPDAGRPTPAIPLPAPPAMGLGPACRTLAPPRAG